jgi:hypothetical protein
MARPQPTILLRREIDNTHAIQILKAEKLWTVVYKDQPFNLRQVLWTVNGEVNKYQRTTFPTEAPAKNLADRLNRWFFTSDFAHKQIM